MRTKLTGMAPAMKSQVDLRWRRPNDTVTVGVLPDIAPGAFNRLAIDQESRLEHDYVVSIRCKFSTHEN
jgi:hypothetical protein